MPDKNGDLTESEKKKVEKWNTQHGTLSLPCSVCGNTDWGVQSKLSGTQEVTIKDGEMRGTLSGISVLTIQCGSCGHLMNFNAQTVGIV